MDNRPSKFVMKINVIGLMIAAIACIIGGIYLIFVKRQYTGIFLLLAGIVLIYSRWKTPKE